ncbi:MAG: division plane positioning ATPase MipZ [Chloroflexia bacterium]
MNATVCEIVRLSGQKTDRPVHVIFYTSYDQRLILEGLSRCLTTLATATPVYDLITQQATFDSDSVTFLDQEIRSLRNYDMLCQSLQAVSTRLGFKWEDGGLNFRRIFRERFFDALAVLDKGDANKRYYTLRSRFSSQIPLEYAYVAWDALEPAVADKKQFEPYKTGWADVEDKLDVLKRWSGDVDGTPPTFRATNSRRPSTCRAWRAAAC